jgi:uncharacterized protein involved in response to NO
MKADYRLFALGFRAFYSLAAIFAIVSILLWLLSLPAGYLLAQPRDGVRLCNRRNDRLSADRGA